MATTSYVDQLRPQILTANNNGYVDQLIFQALTRNPPSATVEGLVLKVLALESSPPDLPTLTVTIR